MSISPAQMMPQVSSAGSASEAQLSTSAAIPSATPAAKPNAEHSTATPAVSPPVQYSTDLQVDNHHQVYYEVVDDRSGDVVFEIPSEALRRIGESLNVPLIGDVGVPSVDVKS